MSGKAIVRGVPSADSLILAKTTGKDQFEDICYLAYIKAPRIGNLTRTEEPYAYEARELIREKIIGRKVDFTVEYMAGSKRHVSVRLDGDPATINDVPTDLASQLVLNSLARVNEKRGPNSLPPLHEALLEIETKLKEKQRGVFCTQDSVKEKHTRDVIYFGEAAYQPSKLLEAAQKEPRPFGAVLEHVFSTTFVVMYVKSLNT